jgi:thioredoxin reductase (NADPH)
VETQTEIVEAMGDKRLECLKIRTPKGEEVRPATSVFLFIGAAPQTDWLPSNIMRDPNGFILSGRDLRVEGALPRIWKEDREPYLLETSMPGVFVAGDVRHGSIKRVASAVGEGSISVQFMHQYLARF